MELNKDKRIGKVLLIVEGSRHEFSLARKVFVNVLGYTQIEKTRENMKYYKRKGDAHSIVAVINTRTSNISSINEEDYLEKIYEELIEQYDFDVDNAAIYYLFDRDLESNVDIQLISGLMKKLKNSRENDDNMRGGMLLLSYPSIESYEVSNFVDESYEIEMRLGKEVKEYINKNAKTISMNKISEGSIIHAGKEMYNFIETLGVYMDLDDFSNTNELVFTEEEQYMEEKGVYRLLSLFSCVLLDLGILKIN